MERIPYHKAGAIIVRDKKVLLASSKGKLIFYWPGGKYEPADSGNPEKCLSRELKEELGVDLISFNHYRTYNFTEGDYKGRHILLELYHVTFSGKPEACSEIEELCWFSREDLISRANELPSYYKQVTLDLIKDGIV
ncbi:MAG: NUDIX domain-containing protein [Nanoarchaeota archaeon]